MTTHHSTHATFTTPQSETFANISRTVIRYFDWRAQKACLANDMKVLRAMDPHMLNDIGLAGFNRLAPAQQESLFLETIKHAS